MSYSVGPAKISLVEFDGRGVTMEAFTSHLSVVLTLLDNGRLGDSYHGSPAHVDALALVEKKIAEVREKILLNRAREIADQLLEFMTADVMGQVPPHLRATTATFQHEEYRERLVPDIYSMLVDGWNPSPDDLDLIAAGEQGEAEEKFSGYAGYAGLDTKLGEIHDEGGRPPEETE